MFYNNKSLKNINILISVHTIFNSCFENCIKLTEVNLSKNNNFKEIYSDAFSECKNLVKFTFPTKSDNNIVISFNAFKNCVKLKEVIFSDINKFIFYKNSFENCIKLNINSFPPHSSNFYDNEKGTIINNIKLEDFKIYIFSDI